MAKSCANVILVVSVMLVFVGAVSLMLGFSGSGLRAVVSEVQDHSMGSVITAKIIGTGVTCHIECSKNEYSVNDIVYVDGYSIVQPARFRYLLPWGIGFTIVSMFVFIAGLQMDHLEEKSAKKKK